MTDEKIRVAKEVFEKFDTEVSCASERIQPWGDGHINETYLVEGKYILQKINTSVFTRPDMLMRNIAQVTEHLSNKIKQSGADPRKETLTLIKTREGENFLTENGSAWRVYLYIPSSSYNIAENSEMIYNEGMAFGKFQNMLSDFDASRLYDVIPNFHNTRKRFDSFIKALKEDRLSRASHVSWEIRFFIDREYVADTVLPFLGSKEVPLRVTHNDTKINNILFEKDSVKPLAVIDLDTVMSGSALYDFGDAIRTGASLANEDETDLSKVGINLENYRAFTEGFIEGCRGRLTGTEISLMPKSAILMTYECGMRFLTDYLDGDRYFRISHPQHNLERCHTQMKMIEDMEKKLDEMRTVTK
ncbi:MAG: aminoglycoside phosphotransferase family protein [Eubacteriales bacterium]|nr:aminoglycoside phosphotransferase family protein [Eubacteriales bacterium]